MSEDRLTRAEWVALEEEELEAAARISRERGNFCYTLYISRAQYDRQPTAEARAELLDVQLQMARDDIWRKLEEPIATRGS